MYTIKLQTTKQYESINITEQVRHLVKHDSMNDGICVIFTPHTTAAIIISENADPNITIDLHNLLDMLIPHGQWKHDKIDNNGAAHLKSAIIGPSETIMVKDGKLMLGSWQNIMFIEFDGPKERMVYVKGISD